MVQAIGYSCTDRVARIVIDQPERRNAMSRSMWIALREAVERADADGDARAVVVEGRGDRAFSAGADMSEFAETYRDEHATRDYARIVSEGQRALARCSKPVVAAIEGACLGGGCGIALAADIRFAGAGARFAITPARIGAAYSFFDTKQLVEAVGPSRAKDMLFSGRMIETDEALRIGLIDHPVASGEARAAALAYARGLAALSRRSHAVTKATVEAIRAGADAPDAELERSFEETFAGADFREGYSAFLAKREPRFT